MEQSGVHLHGAVLHVRDLEQAVGFYTQLFALQVARRDTDAALLGGPDGNWELALRQRAAEHPSGGVGVQALVWEVPDRQELDEHARRLEALTGQADRHEHESTHFVTGRDPDRQRLLLVCPADASGLPTRIPPEVFVWG